MPSLLPLWRASGLVATLSGWLPLGSSRFAVQVDATSIDGATSHFAVTGDGEARTTGLVAAHVVRHLLGSLAPPGVLHIEQLLSLDTLLTDLADDLRLQEIRRYL
ncbi:MAG TPA: hypothetical protein VK879_11830 [Candidatus Sulfomarinibacteraceae bacterium]|nr:hypothetical protein [Candidatus Sulfomarinibacteraceae bacterium]